MSKQVHAWHFTADTLRDGSPIPPVGEPLVFDGELKMCQSGLHASRRAIDALQYAPGNLCHAVRCGGTILEADDKLVCSERLIIWTVDAESVLREFARWCARQVLHLWDAPDVVLKYLNGDDECRAAARDAAWAAALAAARDAAWAAALAAERAAARAAASAAPSARDAAWAAARAAASAAPSARDAAWAAARDAAWDEQNAQLERMITEARNE